MCVSTERNNKMKLRKNQKLELLHAINWLLLSVKVRDDLSLFKYDVQVLLEEQDFLALKDLKTQLSNDIYCK